MPPNPKIEPPPTKCVQEIQTPTVVDGTVARFEGDHRIIDISIAAVKLEGSGEHSANY
jgi:hypothetical protein